MENSKILPRRAILITGFNNWGKSTHIQMLFNGQTKFFDKLYKPYDKSINVSFTVESHSNDDVGEQPFIDLIQKRLKNSPTQTADLLCAFCPTRESKNDSGKILLNPAFSVFSEIHLLLLKYKWDWHAELRIEKIWAYLQSDSRVRFTTIDADKHCARDSERCNARDAQIRSYLRELYP
jgi:hypothetical protein